MAGLSVLGSMLFMAAVALMFRKVGPNEALIIYGFRGTRVVIGRGIVVFPVVETCRLLSLEVMTIVMAPQRGLHTKDDVSVTMEAVAQARVKSDPESIAAAAQQLLTKTPDQREDIIRLVMEERLRGVISQVTAEQIVKEPQALAEQMRATTAGDLNKMGIEMISLTLKEASEGEGRNTSAMSEHGVTIHRRDRAATATGKETAGDK
jgi:flotillin